MSLTITPNDSVINSQTLPLPSPSCSFKQNLPPTDTARLRDLKMQRQKLAGTKRPGVFTHKNHHQSQPQGDAALREIVSASIVYQESLKQWIAELENRLQELTIRNQALTKHNQQLKKSKRNLQEKVMELEHENQLLRNRPQRPHTSILSYLSKQNLMSVIQPPQPFQLQGLEGTYMKCWTDNNSNVRAFYLSMLQYPDTRTKLKKLMQQLQMDDSYKVLPLLDTNQFWVQISENFLEILDQGQFQELEEEYEYLNKCVLLDLVFVSALRSRVEFLADGDCYDSQIENLQLYTVMANNFGLKVQQQISTNYESFRFEGEGYGFGIYITDRNQFLVRFENIGRSLKSSEYELSGFVAEEEDRGSRIEYGQSQSEYEDPYQSKHPSPQPQQHSFNNHDSSQQVMMRSFSDHSMM